MPSNSLVGVLELSSCKWTRYTPSVITMKWVLLTAHAVGRDIKSHTLKLVSVFCTYPVYSARKMQWNGHTCLIATYPGTAPIGTVCLFPAVYAPPMLHVSSPP